jgi:glycosyltransferase involved in cell wall biosynthesis
MDLLVMPSRYENFSNSVLEAMACEVPFLGSDVGGNRIMAQTGAGWLFEGGSASSLAGRLQEILTNSTQLKQRGRLGFKYVQRHHSWQTSATHLEAIIASHLSIQKGQNSVKTKIEEPLRTPRLQISARNA